MNRHTKPLHIMQRILGVKQDADYGAITMAAMRVWQAEHLPELSEVHRGYLTRDFWQRADELGLLTPEDKKELRLE